MVESWFGGIFLVVDLLRSSCCYFSTRRMLTTCHCCYCHHPSIHSLLYYSNTLNRRGGDGNLRRDSIFLMFFLFLSLSHANERDDRLECVKRLAVGIDNVGNGIGENASSSSSSSSLRALGCWLSSMSDVINTCHGDGHVGNFLYFVSLLLLLGGLGILLM